MTKTTDDDTPIYLFQMGKVGSSSLRATLAAAVRNPVIHAHCFDEMATGEKALLEYRLLEKLPVAVITPVREPLSRNVSAFFQNFRRDTGFELSEKHWSVEALLDLFLHHYPHQVPDEWFDAEFRPTFGIDVFQRFFPRQRKWDVIEQDSLRVLIYRCDLDRCEQLEVISGFLGRPIRAWAFANISGDKDYGEMYQEFRQSARLPSRYLSLIGGSRYCRHFWSDEEIRCNAERWNLEPAGAVA